MALLVSIVISSVGILSISCGKTEPKLYHQTQFLLDTFVELTVASPDEKTAQTAMSAAYAEMRRVEALLSRYRPESQIVQINQAAGTARFVPVHPEVSAILLRSGHYAAETNGVFDVTIGGLIDLWGIGTEHERVPDDAEIHQLLSEVDYRHLEVRADQGARLLTPGAALDLGGFAKGYSIDRGIEVLQEHRIQYALLNAGGDIRCIGTKPDGTPWRIGVQHPRDAGIVGVVDLENAAVATSGDYERYFMREGIRYHHLLDPRTGKPARECQSVTIMAPTAEKADVFATAVFILGPEKGRQFIEEQQGIEGMIVRADGTMLSSSGFLLNAK